VLDLEYLVTPQLFVANRPVAFGKVGAAVDEARRTTAPLALEATARWKDGRAVVSARVVVPADAKDAAVRGVDVVAVLFRRAVTTKIERGENGGKELEEFQVVVGTKAVPATRAREKAVELALPAPKGAKAKDLGVAVLVEDGAKMKTLDCVTLALE